MRRALLATLTAIVVVTFVGCSDQQPTSPAEPILGKKPPNASECLTDAEEALSTEIGEDINRLFTGKNTRKTAKGKINNIERKLCKDQYDDATNMAWGFLEFTNDEMPRKFAGSAEDAAELTSKVFELAADPAATEPPMEIPPGAFLPTGSVITFDPADATPEDPIIAATENGEAAVVVDNPNAFPPGTGPVTIALSRAPDADVEEPGGFIPGFQAFPEGYEILSSHQPSPTGGGIIIALCVLDGAPANVVIGHLHDSSVELLVPTDPDPEYLNYIDCTAATTFAMNSLAAPGWLQYARRLVQPVVKLLEPKLLNAMFFRGRGLGGRTTSLSTDAAVDPTIDIAETVQLSVGTVASWNSGNAGVATVNGTGLVTGVAPGTATITADFGDESLSMEITVEAVGGDKIVFSSGRDGNTEIYLMNLDGTGQENLTNHVDTDGGPTWSPDGSKIAFISDRTEENRIYTMNADGTGLSGAMGASGAAWPSWSPDGTKISYTDFTNIRTMNANGSGDASLGSVSNAWTTDWSPDGTEIVTSVGSLGNREIWVMNSDGTGSPTILTTDFDDTGAAWSPDGTQIVFGREDPDVAEWEIYAMDSDGSGQTNLTNQGDADLQPAWSPDGTKIVFWSNRTGASLIYVMNANGSSQSALTSAPGQDFDPEWQPQLPIIIIID